MIECHWAARTADEYEYRCAEFEYEYEYEEQPIASKLGCSSYSVRFADGTRTRTRSIFRYLPAEEQYRYALSRALYVLNAL